MLSHSLSIIILTFHQFINRIEVISLFNISCLQNSETLENNISIDLISDK